MHENISKYVRAIDLVRAGFLEFSKDDSGILNCLASSGGIGKTQHCPSHQKMGFQELMKDRAAKRLRLTPSTDSTDTNDVNRESSTISSEQMNIVRQKDDPTKALITRGNKFVKVIVFP